VIVIGDPYTMEVFPGVYAQGVATIAEEVAKGGAETVLLMPWPGNASTSTVAHYKEVVYRAGRSGPYKVAPAGLAWQAAGSARGATHPTPDGAGGLIEKQKASKK
jgi:dihydroorotase-like cyclic amidohydrolase